MWYIPVLENYISILYRNEIYRSPFPKELRHCPAEIVYSKLSPFAVCSLT